MGHGPDNGKGSLKGHLVDAAAVEAARPYLEQAARFLGWEPDTTGDDWAVPVVAGVASRLRDRTLAPIGLTADTLSASGRLAADLCLMCLCDAISQRSGTAFEYTTMVAFARPPSLMDTPANLERQGEKCAARLAIAVELSSALAADPDAKACFQEIGQSAIRFCKEPSEQNVMSIRSALFRLREILERRPPPKGKEIEQPRVDPTRDPEPSVPSAPPFGPLIVAAFGIVLGVLLTWRVGVFLWACVLVLALVGASTGDPADPRRRINTPGSIALALAIWATFGGALALLLNYLRR